MLISYEWLKEHIDDPGHRVSSLFYQLKIAGFGKIKLYDGSFIE